MNLFILHTLIFFSIGITCTSAINILTIFDFPTRSSVITFAPLLNKLIENGHKVTVIANYAFKGLQQNYKEILLNRSAISTDIESHINLSNSPHWRVLSYLGPTFFRELNENICKTLFSTNDIVDLWQSNKTFDLVIIPVFQTNCVYQLAKQFKCPILGVHTTVITSWTSNKFALPNNPSYIPNFYMPLSSKMTFLQRFENTLITWLHNIYYNIVIDETEKVTVAKYFGTEEAEQLKDQCHKITVILVNTHFSIQSPRPLVPSVIEVGGIHIGQTKTLPKNIEKWINESEHGVIYFSFGSLVKGHTMPAEKREAFIRAFKRLPQRVIWKWENDTMEGKTDNILIGKWLPQFDILSHPNVKAFISHGGLLGTFEAVHCGVPMLVMPQFGDQHTNAKALEAVGGGEILYLGDATEEKIYNALKKILSPSFQEQAKELSERFRDRPMSPLDTAIYWVEYVARHKGAHFMKTAAVGMPFYQYYLLDVIAFILAVLILFFYILYVTLRFFFRLIFKSNFTNKKEKVKKS